jgi:cytochrome c5
MQIVRAQGALMRSFRMTGVLVFFLGAAAMAQAPTYQPVGTVRQIMLGIVKPTSDIIFKVAGEAPKDEKEWAEVQNSALTLAETGNLLLLPGRAKDNGEWRKNAKALIAAGSLAFKAANAKDANALSDIGDKIDETCEGCHAIYVPKPPQ